MANPSVKRTKYNVTLVYPNLKQKTSATELYRDSAPSDTPTPVCPDVLPPIHDEEPTTNSHYNRVHAEALAWENVRGTLLKTHFETLCKSDDDVCGSCGKLIPTSAEHIKCCDCGSGFYCNQKCWQTSHPVRQLPFHRAKRWQSSDQRYVDVMSEVILDRPGHTCRNEQHLRSGIQVFDQNGHVHTVSISVCKCEPDCVSFMRHQIWASTVEKPSVGFHFNLLKWMEYLVLESRLSLTSICQTLRWKNHLTVAQFNTLYRAIVGECFEQFRHFQYKVRSMDFISKELIDDGTCPACPKESGSLFVSLDGNFGLVRKQNSGKSTMPPKHGKKMFASKDDIPKSDTTNNKKSDCSNFQAGNNLRSKNKAAKLDITGVFGSCCRHGVPHTFMDMDEGERLCYSIYVINKLLDQVDGTDIKLHVLYDIACQLDARLKSLADSHRYQEITLAVPIFHVYGHKSSCQVSYSTRWLPGFGLTDGEEMERIWAYLRRFSVVSKEMTPSHRVDLLTDGLLHYKRKKVEEMELTLVRTMKRALSVVQSTDCDLRESASKLSIDINQIDDWITADIKVFTAAKATEEPFTEEEKYVELLQSLDNVVEKFCLCGDGDDEEIRDKLRKEHIRVKAEILKIEKSLKLKTQWRKTDGKYKRTLSQIETKKKKRILKQLHSQAMDYRFIQNLRKKYSDGQSLANRLSKNVQRAAGRIKLTITKFNKESFKNNAGGLPDQLLWSDVVDPCSALYEDVVSRTTNSNCPNSERALLIDLKNRNARAKEEIELTKEEMMAMLQYLSAYHYKIHQMIGQHQPTNDSYKGMRMALLDKADAVKGVYIRSRGLFSMYIQELPADHLNADVEFNLSDAALEEELSILDIDDDEVDEETIHYN